MEPRDREKLQRNYANLLDVSYHAISPRLISRFVLTMDMNADIECLPTERRKMEKLLSILPTRGGDAMKEFINALKPSYSWIARQLLNNDMDNSSRPRQTPPPCNNNRQPPDLSIAVYIRDITRILQQSSQLVSRWTFLANTMSLLPTTVMDIKREMMFSGGHEFAIFSVLEAWLTKQGNSGATFSKLIGLLEREGMNQSAEEVADYWATLEYSDNIHSSGRRPRPAPPVITESSV